MKEAEAPFSTDNGKYTLIQNTDQGDWVTLSAVLNMAKYCSSKIWFSLIFVVKPSIFGFNIEVISFYDETWLKTQS